MIVMLLVGTVVTFRLGDRLFTIVD